MDEKIKLLACEIGENRISTDVNLVHILQNRTHTIAKFFYIATTTRELIRVIEVCLQLKIPFLLIGAGSKIILHKDGFDGLVVKNRSDNLKIFGIKGKVTQNGLNLEEAFLESCSGVSLQRLAEFASNQGLGGFEILKQTPGTLGGSFSMIPILKEKSTQVKVLTSSGYQRSRLAHQILKSDVILSVIFKLQARRV